MTQERIVNECKPYNNDIDKRILYEVTGVKVNEDTEYEYDESSFEEDISVLLNQALGYER